MIKPKSPTSLRCLRGRTATAERRYNRVSNPPSGAPVSHPVAETPRSPRPSLGRDLFIRQRTQSIGAQRLYNRPVPAANLTKPKGRRLGSKNRPRRSGASTVRRRRKVPACHTSNHSPLPTGIESDRATIREVVRSVRLGGMSEDYAQPLTAIVVAATQGRRARQGKPQSAVRPQLADSGMAALRDRNAEADIRFMRWNVEDRRLASVGDRDRERRKWVVGGPCL
jgi:hypothetical protein